MSVDTAIIIIIEECVPYSNRALIVNRALIEAVDTLPYSLTRASTKALFE